MKSKSKSKSNASKSSKSSTSHHSSSSKSHNSSVSKKHSKKSNIKSFRKRKSLVQKLMQASKKSKSGKKSSKIKSSTSASKMTKTSKMKSSSNMSKHSKQGKLPSTMTKTMSTSLIGASRCKTSSLNRSSSSSTSTSKKKKSSSNSIKSKSQHSHSNTAMFSKSIEASTVMGRPKLCKQMQSVIHQHGAFHLHSIKEMNARGYHVNTAHKSGNKDSYDLKQATGPHNKAMSCKMISLKHCTPRYLATMEQYSLRIIRFVGRKPLCATCPKVYEIFLVEKVYYIFMNECHAHSSLYNLVVSNATIKPGTAKHWIHQLVETVCELQKYGIAHRFLKLKHLLLDKSANRIIIVGWSRSVLFYDVKRKKALYQRKERRARKNNFLPPEAFEHATYDPSRADVWSIGVIVVAIHTHRYPFHVRLNKKFSTQWRLFVHKHPLNPIIRSFCNKIFVIDPHKRIHARELLKTSYFSASEHELTKQSVRGQPLSKQTSSKLSSKSKSKTSSKSSSSKMTSYTSKSSSSRLSGKLKSKSKSKSKSHESKTKSEPSKTADQTSAQGETEQGGASKQELAAEAEDALADAEQAAEEEAEPEMGACNDAEEDAGGEEGEEGAEPQTPEEAAQEMEAPEEAAEQAQPEEMDAGAEGVVDEAAASQMLNDAEGEQAEQAVEGEGEGEMGQEAVGDGQMEAAEAGEGEGEAGMEGGGGEVEGEEAAEMADPAIGDAAEAPGDPGVEGGEMVQADGEGADGGATESMGLKGKLAMKQG